MKKRRFVAAFVAIALTIASLGACGSKTQEGTSAEEEYVLKIGEQQGALCHAPLQIAMEKGFLDEEGIKWERVDFGGSDIQAALGAGQIDAGFGLIGKFVQPIENGLNMVVTAGIHTGCTKILVKEDSGIESIADLKGKKIGVSSLAGSEAVTTKRALYQAGVTNLEADGDVEFLVYSVTDQPIALLNGAVDAIATPDPVATNAENEYGLRVLLDTATTKPYSDEYCCISFVSDKVANEYPEIAAGFTRALLKASAWVAAHPEETAQIQIDGEYVSGDAAANAAILKSYRYIPSVQGGYDAFVNMATDLKNIGLLKESTDVDAMIEKSFKTFEGVPDSYEIDGDTYIAVEYSKGEYSKADYTQGEYAEVVGGGCCN